MKMLDICCKIVVTIFMRAGLGLGGGEKLYSLTSGSCFKTVRSIDQNIMKKKTPKKTPVIMGKFGSF